MAAAAAALADALTPDGDREQRGAQHADPEASIAIHRPNGEGKSLKGTRAVKTPTLLEMELEERARLAKRAQARGDSGAGSSGALAWRAHGPRRPSQTDAEDRPWAFAPEAPAIHNLDIGSESPRDPAPDPAHADARFESTIDNGELEAPTPIEHQLRSRTSRRKGDSTQAQSPSISPSYAPWQAPPQLQGSSPLHVHVHVHMEGAGQRNGDVHAYDQSTTVELAHPFMQLDAPIYDREVLRAFIFTESKCASSSS
eukprot:tig00000147_g9482.t1